MGLTALYFECAVAAFLLGMPLMAAGMNLCEKHGYRSGMALAKMGMVLGCLPLPLGFALLWIATFASGVVMEQ